METYLPTMYLLVLLLVLVQNLACWTVCVNIPHVSTFGKWVKYSQVILAFTTIVITFMSGLILIEVMFSKVAGDELVVSLTE